MAQAQVKRLRLILTVLESATKKEHVNAPGLALHQFKGERQTYLAVKVTGNWRVTFRFEDTNVYDVDLEDYHYTAVVMKAGVFSLALVRHKTPVFIQSKV